MEVRGYRIYYINREQDEKDIIKLIEKSRAPKIALVIDNVQKIIKGKININRIKKVSNASPKKIVFVNSSPRFKELSYKKEIIIFDNIVDLENNIPFYPKKKGDKNSLQRRGLKKYLLPLGMLVILLLAGLYFLYPITTIEITPVVKEANNKWNLTASFNEEIYNQKKNIVPLHKFELILKDEMVMETSGTMRKGIKKAKGKIRLINERKEEFLLPKGTIVATDEGIRFKTLKDVMIPGFKVDYLMGVPVGMKAGQTEVDIEAIKAGESDNVDIGKVNKFIKNIEEVYVINSQPIIGGEDKLFNIVCKEDIEKINKSLRAKIVDRALSKIYQELGNNYKVIDSNIVFSNFKIDIDHKTGDIANEIQGTATLKSAGYLLRSSEIEVLINKLYEKNLDKEYKLLNNSINIKSIKLEKLEDDRYNIELESIAHIIPDINLRDLKYRLTGMKKENVIDILDNHDNINEFNIKGENEKIPQIPFAINIVIKKPDSIRVFNN